MTTEELNDMRVEAEKGDRKAMLDFAIALREVYEEEGGGKDEKLEREYFDWIKKSAGLREPEAAYELAIAYKEGFGTQSDPVRFVEWLEEAARLKYLRAIYDLAIAYKEGHEVEQDEKRFFRLMKEAADGGDQDAMLDLAFAFRDGVGTSRRLNFYFSWLSKAAQANNREAMFHLAFAYKNREGIANSNIRQFFHWLKMAAEAGQSDALFHLAIAYRDGEGTGPNRKAYFKWMKLAAEADIPAGLYHLAISYLIGLGVRPDLQQFSLWIRKALEAAHPRAFIASALADLREELAVSRNLLITLNSDLNELFDVVMEIKREHIVKEEDVNEGVAHFTRFEALDNMLPEKPSPDKKTNCLRLYNFAYMNDPQEGKRLLDDALPTSSSLREFFPEVTDADNPISWEEHESSVYIGSFTLRGDHLDMWRTYGSDGQGYCIVTPLEAFDQGAPDESVILHGGEVVKVSEGSTMEFRPTTLYAIRYADEDVKKTLNKLKRRLDKIIEKKRRLRGSTEVLNRTVRLIVSHILYLYKNEQYRVENEVRLIGDFDIRAEYLNLDLREKPSRVFVESPDFLFSDGSRIIIGPKVQNQTVVELDLKYRLARHDLLDNTKVTRSRIQNLYR
jgi:TPR repeat protein